MRWWWDNTIIPLEDAFADEIETQMFPAFGLDAATYRLAWDRSKIPALQEDESAKHAMVCADFKAGVIDHDEARIALGYESKPEYHGKFAVLAKAAQEGADDAAIKAREFRESDWIRNGGRFQSYVGVRRNQMPEGLDYDPSTEFTWMNDPKRKPEEEQQERFKQGLSSLEERRNFIWDGRDVEQMHSWSGDDLSQELRELESEAFRNVLGSVMQELEINTQADYLEAGVSILMREAVKHEDIVEGDLTQIIIPVPPADEDIPYVKLHTHNMESEPSVADWVKFFTDKNYRQMHVLTPTYTHSFYKPPGWDEGSPNEAEALRVCTKILELTIRKKWNSKNYPGAEDYPTEGLELMTQVICKKYDIIYRSGLRLNAEGTWP